MPGIPFVKGRRPPGGLLGQRMSAGEVKARLTQWAFVLAIVLVCARALMSETVRDVFTAEPGASATPRGPGPATSLLLDLLCCVPAFLVLFRRLIDRTYVLRASWAHAMMAGLGLWVAMSVWWSADRFTAAISAANLIGALVLLWSASQLVRSWGRLHFVAAAVFALLLVYIAAGLNQRLSQHPANVRAWYDPNSETSRWRYMKDHGFTENDYQFKRFEANVLSGTLMLFGHSANTYAAAVVVATVVALSILLQRVAYRDGIGWAIAIAVTFPFAAYVLYHTRSLGAAISIVLALSALGAIWRLNRWLVRHSTKAYWIAVAILCLGAAAVVGHGLTHNSLGVRTLTFRWHYWTGAASIVRQHPLAGVGWDNFAMYYPQVRPAQATEEVKDPHNFMVRAFAELGVIGGALFLAWMLRMWWELTRPVWPPMTSAASLQGKRRGIIFLAAPAILIGVVNLVLSVDFSQQSSHVFLETCYRVMAMLLMLGGLAAAGFESLMAEKLDDRPAPWVLYGILVAMGVFLIHNLIDFSLFEPGPMFVFALLAGSGLGVRHPSLAGRRKKTGAVVAGAVVAGLLWLGGAVFVFSPTLAAELDAASADAALHDRRIAYAARLYGDARGHEPANGEYAFRAAQLLALNGSPRSYTLGIIESAIQANPRESKYHRWLASYELRQFSPDAVLIRQAYEAALRLYPRDVGARLEYAAALAQLGDAAAAAQYRQALEYDDELAADEPKRIPKERRAEIEQRVRELK